MRECDKHFPKDHKLRKILIKISYSCMNNTKQIIDNHNKRILTASIRVDNTAAAAIIGNRRQKNACPLDGNCLQPSVIYQATVTRKDNNTTETYIGLTEKHTLNTVTPPNSASTSGPSKTTVSNTLFPGARLRQQVYRKLQSDIYAVKEIHDPTVGQPKKRIVEKATSCIVVKKSDVSQGVDSAYYEKKGEGA